MKFKISKPTIKLLVTLVAITCVVLTLNTLIKRCGDMIIETSFNISKSQGDHISSQNEVIVSQNNKIKELNQEISKLKQSEQEKVKQIDQISQQNRSFKAQLDDRNKAKNRVIHEQQLSQRTLEGNKLKWLTQSGIPKDEWKYVDFIVTKESGWNPLAINPRSGACGLGQQLPCGKWGGGHWADPVAALRGMNRYVINRYKSWEKAYNFWLKNKWY